MTIQYVSDRVLDRISHRHIESSLRMRVITWYVPLCKILVHILMFLPTICLFNHFYWAPMKNKGCAHSELLMLNAKSNEIFPSPNFFSPNYDTEPGDQGIWKVAILLQRAHIYVNPRRLSHFAWRSSHIFVINIHGIRGYKGHVNKIAISQIEIKYHKWVACV